MDKAKDLKGLPWDRAARAASIERDTALAGVTKAYAAERHEIEATAGLRENFDKRAAATRLERDTALLT